MISVYLEPDTASEMRAFLPSKVSLPPEEVTALYKYFSSPALFIPSDIAASSSPVYITALVGESIVLSTLLHLHHSLFNMEQGQNLKGTRECSIS